MNNRVLEECRLGVLASAARRERSANSVARELHFDQLAVHKGLYPYGMRESFNGHEV